MLSKASDIICDDDYQKELRRDAPAIVLKKHSPDAKLVCVARTNAFSPDVVAKFGYLDPLLKLQFDGIETTMRLVPDYPGVVLMYSSTYKFLRSIGVVIKDVAYFDWGNLCLSYLLLKPWLNAFPLGAGQELGYTSGGRPITLQHSHNRKGDLCVENGDYWPCGRWAGRHFCLVTLIFCVVLETAPRGSNSCKKSKSPPPFMGADMRVSTRKLNRYNAYDKKAKRVITYMKNKKCTEAEARAAIR